MDISLLLLSWYQDNRRILPWRKDKDPYHVWISEIMLQQTRIEAVISYYERFIERIPDIFTLANISEDELLKLWEGLGYYSRARNLKKAAMMIMNDFGGVFPSIYEEILKLPGIGEYTASAIASICFGAKTPTIDGNVLRVYTRMLEDERNVDLSRTKKQIREEIEKIMPKDTGNFNEAFMELGEVVCLPSGKPKCEVCPLKEKCCAYKHQSWSKFPVKTLKQDKKEYFYTVFLLCYQDKVVIRKRTDGLLKNLWEFPSVLGKMSLKEIKTLLKTQNIAFKSVHKSVSHKHVFSHQIWYMQAYVITLTKYEPSFCWASGMKLCEKYAIPGAFQPFLKAFLHNI